MIKIKYIFLISVAYFVDVVLFISGRAADGVIAAVLFKLYKCVFLIYKFTCTFFEFFSLKRGKTFSLAYS